MMQSDDTPILICYDGSPAAVRAIETAAALLGPRRAVVLDVASSMTVAESFAAPYSAMAGAAVEETHAAEAARIADEGTEIARSSGFDAVARRTRAVPTWEGIVEIADELDAPVIVVGHLSQGFALPADRLVVLSEEDIFGERRHRRGMGR